MLFIVKIINCIVLSYPTTAHLCKHPVRSASIRWLLSKYRKLIINDISCTIFDISNDVQNVRWLSPDPSRPRARADPCAIGSRRTSLCIEADVASSAPPNMSQLQRWLVPRGMGALQARPSTQLSVSTRVLCPARRQSERFDERSRPTHLRETPIGQHQRAIGACEKVMETLLARVHSVGQSVKGMSRRGIFALY
jgi:hypothetical protein